MLTNIPAAEELNEIALRLYFDAWGRTIDIVSNFTRVYKSDEWPWENGAHWEDEWKDYLSEAQSELGAIAATAQHSAEVRLKSIICETSPYILLLGGDLRLKQGGGDLDFADQRTIDSADLPAAVRTLTPFHLPDSYVKSYQDLRRVRNKVVHIGRHQGQPEPRKLIGLLAEQYTALWPDGRWLRRRVEYDGNSASLFFIDGRYSSIHSHVMHELPVAIALFDNKLFRKCVGTTKSSLKGHCPACKDNTASKGGRETEPTVAKTGANKAKCFMCESDLVLETSSEMCDCGSKVTAASADQGYQCCFNCGYW